MQAVRALQQLPKGAIGMAVIVGIVSGQYIFDEPLREFHARQQGAGGRAASRATTSPASVPTAATSATASPVPKPPPASPSATRT
jgi:hypothetical protein